MYVPLSDKTLLKCPGILILVTLNHGLFIMSFWVYDVTVDNDYHSCIDHIGDHFRVNFNAQTSMRDFHGKSGSMRAAG